MIILDGKKVKDQKEKILKDYLASVASSKKLVIIDIGGEAATQTYIKQKKSFGETIGVEVLIKTFIDESEEEIISYIEELNRDSNVNGVIVQIPIKDGYSEHNIVNTIAPEKDVDGLTDINKKTLYAGGEPLFVPATAQGVVELLEAYNFSFTGTVLIIGESELTGKPIGELLKRRGMEVGFANEFTENIPEKARAADLLVSATGVPGLITKEYVHEKQWIVDVGFSMVEKNGEKKIMGDVQYDEVKDLVAAITPVPGGVGPMTVATLFSHLVQNLLP